MEFKIPGGKVINENELLEKFSAAYISRDNSKSENVKLALFISSPEPAGLAMKVGWNDFQTLLSLWDEKRSQSKNNFGPDLSRFNKL